MANLRLTLACGPYDRTHALSDGSIRPDGIELNYSTLRDIPLTEGQRV